MLLATVRDKRWARRSSSLTLYGHFILAVAVQPTRTAEAKLPSMTAARSTRIHSVVLGSPRKVSVADICQVVTCNLCTPSPGWALYIAEAFRMMKLLQGHKGHRDPPLDSCDLGESRLLYGSHP